MNEKPSVNEILNKIAESKRRYAFPVFIPSLNKEVPFYQMTTAQQKNFVKASMSDDSSFSETMYAIFGIIKENCADPTVNVGNFNLIDKLIIAISIRMMSIAPLYKVVVNDIKDAEGNPLHASVNLESLVKKIIKQFKGKTYGERITADGTDISVDIDIPTIADEVSIEKDFEEKARIAASKEQSDSYAESMGDLYVLECVKYMRGITIKDGDETKTISLSEMPSSERKEIFESLPTALSSKIIDRVNEITEELNSVSLLKITHEGTPHQYAISLTNPAFFIAS